jgi:acyl-CoA synthetase (AMP-forming)/AMP-acid ligase II
MSGETRDKSDRKRAAGVLPRAAVALQMSEFFETLPKSGSGKTLKRDLRQKIFDWTEER